MTVGTEQLREMSLATVVDSDEGDTKQQGESTTLSRSVSRVKPVSREPDSYEKRGFQYLVSVSKIFQRDRWDRIYGKTRTFDQGPLK